MSRPDHRKSNQLRPLSYTWDVAPNALASILLKCGATQVICSVSVEESVPKWMEQQKAEGGWLTSEYSMLPYSTLARKPRDISRGKLDGRSQEIQRLIGRSLRAAIDLSALGPRSLWIDCDVLAADGGTRTTAITGSYLALKLAIGRLLKAKLIARSPLISPVAATSVGLVKNRALLDLCYVEDKDASVDLNVVMNGEGRFIEIQAAGEEATFSPGELARLLKLGKKGIEDLFQFQQRAWSRRPR